MDFQGGMIVLIVFVSLFAIWLLFYFIPVGLWFSALVSGVRISLLQLVLMRWRKVPPSTIVSSMIESTKAGLTLNPNELEAHYLAGGNVTNVVHALVSAQKANIMLDFKMATAIDLAGRDVFEAVQMSVNPKVINTPPVAAVAKDGIQLIAKARVTVRANIKQLVGGAAVRNVGIFKAGRSSQNLRTDVVGCPVAIGGSLQLAGVVLCELHQILQRVELGVLLHQNHGGLRHMVADGSEAVHGIRCQTLGDGGVEVGQVDEAQRVAIRGRLREGRPANGAGAAFQVFNDDRLADVLFSIGGQHTGGVIGSGTRFIGYDHGNIFLGGPVLI